MDRPIGWRAGDFFFLLISRAISLYDLDQGEGEFQDTYTGAYAAITHCDIDVLEWLAVEIKRDLAAVAAPSIALGGVVQIRHLRAIGWCALRFEAGAVE